MYFLSEHYFNRLASRAVYTADWLMHQSLARQAPPRYGSSLRNSIVGGLARLNALNEQRRYLLSAPTAFVDRRMPLPPQFPNGGRPGIGGGNGYRYPHVADWLNSQAGWAGRQPDPNRSMLPPDYRAGNGVAPVTPVMPTGSGSAAGARAARMSPSTLHWEQRKVDAFLQEIQNAPVSQPNVTPWHRLTAQQRAPYANEHEYLQVATQAAMDEGNRRLGASLARHGLRAVPNEGGTDEIGANNLCFKIAALQQATRNFRSSHVGRAVEHRNALRREGLVEDWETENEMITSDSEAAKRAVDLINQDPNVWPKLDVHVISSDGSRFHVDRLGDRSPGSRKVLIWDQGGHFEAVTPFAE